MKYDMEDLLKKAYSQKEKPTQEFCRSLIGEMKAKEGRIADWKAGWGKSRLFFAAACVGMVLLAGIVVKSWRMGNEPHYGQQGELAEAEESFAPAVTDSTGDENGKGNNRVGSALAAILDKWTADKGVDPGGENQEEGMPYHGISGNASNQERETGQGRGKGKNTQLSLRVHQTELPQESDSSLGLSTGKPGMKTTEPVNQTPQPLVVPASVVVVTPLPDAVIAPTETIQPTAVSASATIKTPLPEETIASTETVQPEETWDPVKNYVDLCSMETCIFSSVGQEANASPAPGTELPEEFPQSNLFENKMISSYEQLQELIQKAEKEGGVQLIEEDMQMMLGQLKKYGKEYFESNLLCIHMYHLEDGLELRLASVDLQLDEQGKTKLTILPEKKYLAVDGAEASDHKRYYGCLVQIPKMIAGACDYVVFKE